MNNDKLIFTDCDGVLLNWEYAFHQWMEFRGHKRAEGNAGHAWDLGTAYPNVTNVREQIRSFNESAAVGFLPPLRDAQYYVRRLHEEHNYRFVCVTSMTTDPYAVKLRERNLAKLFGDNTFKEVICLDCGEGKEEILQELYKEYCPDGNRKTIWIEDKLENAMEGLRAGFKSILMAHGYNRNLPLSSIMDGEGNQLIRVLNWERIYQIALDEGESYDQIKDS